MSAPTLAPGALAAVPLRKPEYDRLAKFIYEQCGIRIGAGKTSMLEARLQKRLRELGLRSFGDYCTYLFSDEGRARELVPMIDLVTTNKTDFFRESNHLDYLCRTAVPQLIATSGAGVRRELRVWSAGCSTGEEPYSLAMVLSEFAAEMPHFRFGILATDISTRVLQAAKSAIYDEERVEPVPPALRSRYLLRSKDRARRQVRVVPRLRALCEFRRLNFMDADYGLEAPVDVVFCRNVIIYFDKPTQERMLNRICRHLAPGGFVFMGHSETLFGLDVPLSQVAPTVYRKAAR